MRWPLLATALSTCNISCLVFTRHYALNLSWNSDNASEEYHHFFFLSFFFLIFLNGKRCAQIRFTSVYSPYAISWLFRFNLISLIAIKRPKFQIFISTTDDIITLRANCFAVSSKLFIITIEYLKFFKYIFYIFRRFYRAQRIIVLLRYSRFIYL